MVLLLFGDGRKDIATPVYSFGIWNLKIIPSGVGLVNEWIYNQNHLHTLKQVIMHCFLSITLVLESTTVAHVEAVAMAPKYK